MKVNTIDEEIEEAADLKIDDVKNLKEEFSARGENKSEEDTETITARSKEQKRVSKKSSSHNPTEESGQSKNMLELAAQLGIKKTLQKVKEEIHDKTEIERIEMEMNILKGKNPLAAGNTIQTYKHVDSPTENQKSAVTQFAKA